MSEYRVSVPDEAAEYFIARFGLDGTKMMGYDLTGEIVRCRDCKHYIHNDGCMERCARHDSYFVSSDGYCAWGEKKEGVE